MSTQNVSETRSFQAEVQEVLKLMINSLYSNKEIFLRELISNASDACDKLRFEALKDDGLYAGNSALEVKLSADADARTLTIRDSGIGMSRDEVIENIGTIARSGTKRFMEAMSGEQRQDANMIGQFGVGFYSAFIVADKVTLTTRKAGDTGPAIRWESTGEGEYTLSEVPEFEGRGTEVVLHLREEEDEFTQSYRLRSLVNKYSDHIAFPVQLWTPPVEKPEGEEGEAEPGKWETINQAKALWQRAKNEIKDEEYQEFYKHISHDFADALAWTHNKVEGNQSYTNLLYLPENPPFDLFTGREERQGLKLYVKRVFIMDAAEQLLPAYLRFVRGVVDSDDLPLNVSREILQDNALVRKIRAACVKRVLDLLDNLAKEDSERYAKFWNAFGAVLKEGPAEDFGNKERIAKLLRFASTQEDNTEQTVSLDDYIGRMKGDQDKIYYLTADSFAAAKNSPQLEAFRKKGIEVLLLWDRVDEWMMSYLTEYEGKSFQSVAKGDVDLADSEEEKAEREKLAEENKTLTERLAKVLEADVKEVRVSQRLTDSPSCLVLNDQDMAVHMQKLLKQAGHDVPDNKPTLEINPAHPLVKQLDGEANDDRFADWGRLLFEQALLAEGGQLEDPASFVRRLNSMFISLDGKGEAA
jgi:molecular chaperone HtpG